MPRLTHCCPKYRRDRASGQAVVTIHGKDYYLGPWLTVASRAEYDRLISGYLAGGRENPRNAAEPIRALAVPPSNQQMEKANTVPISYGGYEKLIRLGDVPRLDWLPNRRAGSRLNVSTVWRWALRGCAGVKLATVSVGGTLATTESDLQTFFYQVGQARLTGQPANNIRTPRQRERDYQAALERLALKGIGPGADARV